MLHAILSDEHFWFDALTVDERAYYERAMSAIIRWYGGNIAALRAFEAEAYHRGYTASPTVRAVLWRLDQELDDD